MTDLISIVIPAYNAERFLPLTIDSVLSQTHTNWELIVVNDGSKDSTPTIIQAYEVRDKRIRGLHLPNGGVCKARNTGFDATDPSSNLVIFLDSDDIWEPSTLEKLLNCLNSHPESVCAYGLVRFINEKGEPISPGFYEYNCRQRPTYNGRKVVNLPLDQPTTFSTCIVAFPGVIPGGILIRKETYAAIGGFDPGFTLSEDWDLYIRLSRHGSFQFINELVLGYRRHDSNVSSSGNVSLFSRRVLLKARASADNSPEQRKIALNSYRPAQRYFMEEKINYMSEALRKGNLSGVLQQAKTILGHLIKYLRNHP